MMSAYVVGVIMGALLATSVGFWISTTRAWRQRVLRQRMPSGQTRREQLLASLGDLSLDEARQVIWQLSSELSDTATAAATWPDATRRSLLELVERHAALRTAASGGGPVLRALRELGP